MTTLLLSQNVQLRKRMREMEEEIAFLREQNYRIRQMSDSYREKVSELVASIRFKDHPDTPLIFETKEELEEVVKRLRAHDITRTPSQPLAAQLEVESSAKAYLSGEGDDGLIHSTSSLPHCTQDEKFQRKGERRSEGSKKEPIRGGKPTCTTENVAAQTAQRSAIARLTSENKNLASLVDTLRLRVATVVRLNTNLEKKIRGLQSQKDNSHGSSAGRSRHTTMNGNHSLSPTEKRLRKLEIENNRLRTAADRSAYLEQEVSHYRALLERQTAEAGACRQRELSSVEEKDGIKMDLVKANETLRELKTALRLSRVREKRATSSRETSWQQQMVSGEQRTPLSLVMNQLASSMAHHHHLLGEYLLILCVVRITLAGGYIGEKKGFERCSRDDERVTLNSAFFTGTVGCLVERMMMFEEGERLSICTHSVVSPPLNTSGGGKSACESEDDEKRMDAALDTGFPTGAKSLGTISLDGEDGQAFDLNS